MNINNLVSSILTPLNPYRDFVFTTKTIVWEVGQRDPIETIENITIQGKIQPVGMQELVELQFDLQEFQYYRIYVSYTATQLDKLRQFGSDFFMLDNKKYRIVGRVDWSLVGWTEAYCYLDEVN